MNDKENKETFEKELFGKGYVVISIDARHDELKQIQKMVKKNKELDIRIVKEIYLEDTILFYLAILFMREPKKEIIKKEHADTLIAKFTNTNNNTKTDGVR